MRFYKGDVLTIIRDHFVDRPVNRNELFRLVAKELPRALDNPMFMSVMHQQLTGEIPGWDAQATSATARNTIGQVMMEMTALYRGVEIYVEDRQLIQALLDTDIDAIMGDVRMPFPYCEFCFPDGMQLGYEDYELTGCLLADLNHCLYDVWQDRCKVENLDRTQFPPANMLGFYTRLHSRTKGIDRQGVSYMYFQPATGLDVPLKCPVAANDSHALRVLAKLVLGLCLYLQTKEGQKAVIPRPIAKKKRNAYAGRLVADLYGRRRKYEIQDLISHTFTQQDGTPGEGHHASPHTHWRKLHMRSLRNDRYRRNEDGSVRVIWVRSTLVNAAAAAEELGERDKRRI